MALPEKLANKGKYDFYELLKDGGIEAVQKCLEQRVEIKDVQVLKESGASLEANLKQLHLIAPNSSREVTSKEYKNVDRKQVDRENASLMKTEEERER
jgi:galactokinase/mevalonate kinase-like predicted kinase